MIRRLGLTSTVFACLTLSATASQAALFTTDQASFLAANPALALEDFEAANLASGTDQAFLGPLNSATNNVIFAAGSVIDGFELTPTGGGDIYVSRDFGGNAGVNVSSNQFTADINIALIPGVTALGIDLVQWQGHDDGWTIEIFDAANTSLGTFNTPAQSFVGVTSPTPIARLFINKPNTGAVIDNLRFGFAGELPEPTSLLLLGAGLALAGRRLVRK